MSADAYREKVFGEIDRRMASLAGHVVNGNVADMGDYRFCTGQIRGLDVAKAVMDEVFKKMYSVRKVGEDDGGSDQQTAA